MKNLFILDNGGETFDRFTIVDEKTGDIFGASCEPFNPLGFGQYCGNVADNYWRTAFGIGWKKDCNKRLLNKRIKYAIDLFKADCGNVGKPIEWEQLPEPVKQFAEQVFAPDYLPY